MASSSGVLTADLYDFDLLGAVIYLSTATMIDMFLHCFESRYSGNV